MIREGELVIVDGREGVLIANPGAQVLEEYRLLRSKIDAERQKLKHLSHLALGDDGRRHVELQANIELPQEGGATKPGPQASVCSAANFCSSTGTISPPRTSSSSLPQVADAMHGRPVRSGRSTSGDKSINGADGAAPPGCSLRAIRFCLAEPQMFRRSCARPARLRHGKIRLLIPMLATPRDRTDSRARAAGKGNADDHKSLRRIQIGAMIEVPAAAFPLNISSASWIFLDRDQRPDPVHACDRPHRR